MYIFNLGEIAGRCAYFITLSDTPKGKMKKKDEEEEEKNNNNKKN